MKSPTSPMRPGSVERPPSARSIRNGNRQLLQLVTNRRVYIAENNIPAGNNQSNNSEQNSKTSPFNWLVNTTNAKTTNEDAKDVGEENRNNLKSTQLKHLIFKQLDKSPIEVQVRCVFMRVGEIDTLNERYYAEILFEASWEEQKLKGLQKKSFDPMVYWTPQLELVNGIGEIHDTITYSVRHDRQGIATVTEHHKLKGTLWERMELQYFPLDVQELSLSITTSHSSKEMIFVKNLRKPSGANRQVFTDQQEWYLFEHVDIEITERIEEYLEDGNNHSVVICSCHAAR
ncbi:unnamed protein product [Rotaria sp. Silwood2]|nr:unnamed protein product [Rotaria sp. Silwood2]CAF4007607.1 unnamed protein product [Rotaria sp. Silwood2]CAF4074161.1 unnamed protein product [Rotaria sp. Silwood2]